MRIAVLGLGYVGLPLAISLSRSYETYGFDISGQKIKDLNALETSDVTDPAVLGKALKGGRLNLIDDPSLLTQCSVFIITVPTPVTSGNSPDFGPLLSASETVGKAMSKGAIVVYESTVFPGATEELCVPVLEAISKLRFGVDFNVGYSPERVNPGDSIHTLENIIKIISSDCEHSLSIIEEIYSKVTKAGIYKAESIRVAEAAKVLENTQRDLNIALMNELALLCQILGIDTNAVIDTASTKWNFNNYRPGLVGGHCIGVDPYYLTFKAESVGYYPQVILAGRRVNDQMPQQVANIIMKRLLRVKNLIREARICFLGITFKENCADTRNSKNIALLQELEDFGLAVDVVDPFAPSYRPKDGRNLPLVEFMQTKDHYDAIVIAVPHNAFLSLGLRSIRRAGRVDAILFDIKKCFHGTNSSTYWSL